MNNWPMYSNLKVILSDGLGVDPEGNKQVRTKQSHPYSYDAFIIWRNEEHKPTSTIYSDRLLQWDFAKHDTLCKKHFGDRGQYWNNRQPEIIEAFLRDWCEDNTLILTCLTEYCNASNITLYCFYKWRQRYGETISKKPTN